MRSSQTPTVIRIRARFTLPEPIMGRGNFYTAVPIPNATDPNASQILMPDGRPLATVVPDGYPLGELIDNYTIMDAYNATLSYYANHGWLPMQRHALVDFDQLCLCVAGEPVRATYDQPGFLTPQCGPLGITRALNVFSRRVCSDAAAQPALAGTRRVSGACRA